MNLLKTLLLLSFFSGELYSSELAPLYQELETQVNNDFHSRCETELSRATLTFDNFSNFDLFELKNSGDDLIKSSFDLRVKIREMLGKFSPSCVYKARSLFRAMRAVEDLVGEVYYNEKQITPQEIDFFKRPIPLKDFDFYHGHLGHASPLVEFKAGDIMITRGVSYQSALIAQIAKPQGQYSHIVFTHVDDQKKMWTIESYISSGVDIFDETYALQNENARIMLLRPKDSELATRASNYIYDLAKSRKEANNPIPYDFYLDFENHDKLSCAEIAKMAYETESGGEFVIPYYPSKITLKNQKFLKSLGLIQREIFEPIDMEVDPRFDLILEWRDYSLMRDSRHKDAVLFSILDWIDNKNYKLSSNLKASIAGLFIYPARETFLWKHLLKLGVPNFSENIPKSAFMTNVRLTAIADILIDLVRREDRRVVAKRGYPMTMLEIKNLIEKIRQEDLENYEAGLTSKFHYFFR